MPYIKINDANLYYDVHGIGPEVMLFCHGVMTSGDIFKYQYDYFKARYKCIVFDLKGHGRSEAGESQYDIETLAGEVVELIKELHLGPCHFVGISTGGFIGLRLAARHRELIKSLILISTSADAEDNKLNLNLFKTFVGVFGPKVAANRIMQVLFGSTFLEEPSKAEDVLAWRTALIRNKKSITRALAGHINREPIDNELDNISVPTLVMAGDEDRAIRPESSKNIKLKIPQARLAILKGTGHSPTIEDPWQLIDTVEVFLNGVH